ncbi:MAG: TonB-dependent receptor, partial [Candidatus Aureabacteria bacterium]|nr:TonB-dependent receptor [Candidatus Auribacterota bacterium]
GYMDGGRSKRMCTFFKGRYEMKEISMELISGYSDFDIGEYEQKRFFIRTELDGHDFYSGLKINSDALFSNQDLAGSLFINGIKNKGQRRYYLLDEADTLHDVTNASESRVGIRADLFYQFNDNAMTIEVNHDQSVLESSNFDGEMKVRRSWFSIQDEYEFSKKVSAEVQGRYDSNSAFSDEGSFGAGIMLKGVKGWNIRQFFSRDFNAPPLAEKFMDRPELGLKSNESLSAETGYTWQMSLEKSFFEKWLAQIKTYIQKLQDGIIVSMDEEGFFYYDNADSIKRQGVEVNLTWMPFEKTLLKAGAAFNDVKNEDTDETVSGRERLKYTFDLEQKLPQNCTFTMTGYYLWWNMEEIYHSKERNFLFNAKYSWQPKKSFSLYGAVYNLFDTELYWIDVYPNPERSYEAGFEYQF